MEFDISHEYLSVFYFLARAPDCKDHEEIVNVQHQLYGKRASELSC